MFVGTFDVWASRSKVAVIDMRKIWREYKGMQDVVKRLRAETAQKQESIDAQRREIIKLREDYESKLVILSDTEKEKKSEEIDIKAKKLQEYVRAVNKEFQALDAQLRGKIIDDVKRVVTAYGEKKGFHFILNKSEAFVLYVKDSLDVTDAIMEELSVSYPYET